MKHIVNMAIVVIALAAIALAQEQGGQNKAQANKTAADNAPMSRNAGGNAKDAVTKLERDWESAMQKNDDAAVSKILSNAWIATNPDGSDDTKAHFLSDVKSGKYSNVKLDSVNVHTFGNTAVATGKSTDKDGKYSYLDVFVKQGGTWKCVASSLSKIG